MSALRLKPPFAPRQILYRYLASSAQNEEYTATPQYPPILELTREKNLERKQETEHEAIKSCATIEEKQIKLNMPRYYGFRCHILEENYIPYNNLNLSQHITRTHLIKTDKLPNFYDNIDVKTFLPEVKNEIEDVILLEMDRFRQRNDVSKAEADNAVSQTLSTHINRIIINNLKNDYSHLKNVQVDFDARVESFWSVGGFNPTEMTKKSKLGLVWLKDQANEPVDRHMNYLGSASVALRCAKPLNLIVSPSDAENPDLDVPFYRLDPRTVGIRSVCRHIANVPGFWPGDPNEFGLLSYHKRGHILSRHYNDAQDDKEALDRQAILASFAWLHAQANLQGFTTFNDLTYPLVTQTVITNGQTWSFYVYQMSTVKMHGKYIWDNAKRNICWALPELKLYDGVENDKLLGFNEEVLETLLKLYANVPEDRLGIAMKPYVGKGEKFAAEYEDDEKREWLEREYKWLMANRPRDRLAPEIFAWEKIYKIDHNTRFMDKKRRPFEFKINPFKRRLDERKPRYIPRALRPDLPRWKGRDAKEYFP